MQAPSSEKEHQDNYNGFDLLDEQIVVSAQQQSCRCNDWRICNESTALVDQSSWYTLLYTIIQFFTKN